MRIVITTPSMAPHGGIFNILEIANRLQDFGHEVTIFNQSPNSKQDRVKLTCKVVIRVDLRDYDCLICSSPHAVDLLDNPYPAKKIVFMQMLEHLFRPEDKAWGDRCKRFYNAPYPMISTATWGVQGIGREADVLGTGVNLDHFPISDKPKDGMTILLESPEPTNPAKDVDRLALKAAKLLKDKGFRIIAYGAIHIHKEYSDIPHEYYLKPSLNKMNELYERSTILLKATKYDFRSTAPLEAMTKGCVTVRAIEKGDEDLLHTTNSVVSMYGGPLFEHFALDITRQNILLPRLMVNCLGYVQKYSWDYWMPKYNEVICR